MHEIEEITELARDPRWRGVPEGPHVSRSGRNPYCGDVITLHTRVDSGIGKQVRTRKPLGVREN
ncbi:MAG: hypothetical protein KDA90_20930 [Planctomycetaceae bacterium]|nr:hypothetical protein [Planctomycetaceae bacterium]